MESKGGGAQGYVRGAQRQVRTRAWAPIATPLSPERKAEGEAENDLGMGIRLGEVTSTLESTLRSDGEGSSLGG